MEAKEKEIENVPGVRYDPEMDKYDNVILFPEKLKRAKENIKKSNLLEFLNKIKEESKEKK